MYKYLKPLLFSFEPETAHQIAMQLLEGVLQVPLLNKPFKSNGMGNEVKLGKLTFKNPLGLAAGFDKNAAHLGTLAQLGFSHIEIGTVTPKPQGGNSKPRLFRLKAEKALINRMGFNNVGADLVAKRLEKRPTNILLGGNIGKNKDTTNENALADYLYCFEKLAPHVDYFTINISSPNTPNLRALQEKEPLNQLLHGIQNANQKQETPKPLFLKLAPDLGLEQLQELVEICVIYQLDALIATNTTLDRSALKTTKQALEAIGNGGLSGMPLTEKVHSFTDKLLKISNNCIPIIASGGIMSLNDAQNRLDMGCKLVQVYTGFVYEGVDFIHTLSKRLQTKG